MKLQQKLLTFLAITTLFAGFTAVYVPSTAQAADCSSSFLSFPAWYDGLTDGNCNVQSPDAVGGLSSFIMIIVLNLVEILLRVVGYISVGFIMYGGFIYLTSGGESDRIASGRKIIMNAVVGLVISFFSTVIIGLFASNIVP